MFEDMINHAKIKKRYFIIPIPFCYFLMDLLVFMQKLKIEDPNLRDKAISNIYLIAFIFGAVIFTLIFCAIILNIKEKRILRDKRYLDEIVRKFFVPLNCIIGVCENINTNSFDAKKAQQNKLLLLETSLRLKKSLQDTDEYNNLINKRTKLEVNNTNLYELVNNIQQQINKVNPNHNVTVVNNVPKEICVKVDSSKAQKIISNVIISLINYTEKGKIEIVASNKGFEVAIKIIDYGLTFREDIKEIVFEPQDGANNMSNVQYSGTGLALAIAYELTKLHHGSISIDKHNDKEAVFNLTFPKGNGFQMPLSKSNDDYSNFRETGRNLTKIVHSDKTSKGRVLMIKGNSIHKEILMQFIFDENYDIFAPAQPLMYIENKELDKEFDLIIIDEMYEFSSFDLCKELRNRYEFSQLPILLLVPNDRQANLKKAYEVGANDCIDYLVIKQQLLAKVNTLVQIKKATENLVNSQVSLLQSQIQPHFLYNALNTITQLCLENPTKAYDVLIDFSQYLRSKFSFKNPNRAVPINDELATIKSYLNVEKARFGERLNYQIDYIGKGERLIPALIIQPFVENSVKHGISKTDFGGNITVTIIENTGDTYVSIVDDGDGINIKKLDELTNGDPSKLGTGISNVIRRLKLYGCKNFSIESALGKGVKICFNIPCNWNVKYEGDEHD